jgi:type IV pilus assembly protein PilA
MRKQKGFSLIELLIVVAIILIIAAIAIPNLLRARIAANESSAVASIRTLNTARDFLQLRLPDSGLCGRPCPTLAGTSCTPPSSAGACLIDTQLGSGTKSGYSFTCSGSGGNSGSAYPLDRKSPLTSEPDGRALVLLVRGRGGALQHHCADHLRWNRAPAAVSLDLAKYLGEGTSRKEAEEKSSAFFIVRHFPLGF